MNPKPYKGLRLSFRMTNEKTLMNQGSQVEASCRVLDCRVQGLRYLVSNPGVRLLHHPGAPADAHDAGWFGG